MNSNTGSLEMIKRINRQLILDKIKKEQPVSRAWLARELALSKTTVSAICDELLASRMIVDLGEKGPKKGSGRPAKMLGFNPLSAYGLGVDLHPDRALAAVADLEGRILYRMQAPASEEAEQIAALAWRCAQAAGISMEDVAALGVSVPGVVNKKGTVVRANCLGWRNYDLQGALAERLPCRIAVNTEANCAALGERWRGAGEIGYLLSGQEAAQGLHNELGQPGVFEHKLMGLLQSGGLGPEQAVVAYVRGEEPAHSMIQQFIQFLSWAVANLVCLLNPEIVVIGGAAAQHLGPVLPAIRAVTTSLTPVRTHVTLGTLGPWASVVGAVAGALGGSAAARPQGPMAGE